MTQRDSIELISPDAYEYLETGGSEDLLHDEILEEQEEQESSFLFDDEDAESEEEHEEEYFDDSEFYSSSSLFDEIDEEEEEEEAGKESAEEDTQASEIFDDIDYEEEHSDAEPAPAREASAGPVFVPLAPVEPSRAAEPEVISADIKAAAKPDEGNRKTQICDAILEKLTGNTRIRNYLREQDDEILKDISLTIDQARRAWLIDGKDKMFTIPYTDISVIVCSSLDDPMAKLQRQVHAAALMLSEGKEKWNILYVAFDRDQKLLDAVSQEISRRTFSDWQWKRVLSLYEVLSKK